MFAWFRHFLFSPALLASTFYQSFHSIYISSTVVHQLLHPDTYPRCFTYCHHMQCCFFTRPAYPAHLLLGIQPISASLPPSFLNSNLVDIFSFPVFPFSWRYLDIPSLLHLILILVWSCYGSLNGVFFSRDLWDRQCCINANARSF